MYVVASITSTHLSQVRVDRLSAIEIAQTTIPTRCKAERRADA